MTMDRRTLIRSAVALTAAAFIPLPVLAETPQERFERLAATGLIEGETFDLVGGPSLTIDHIDGLTIRDCRFRYSAGGDAITVQGEVHNFTMVHCHFEGVRDGRHPDAASAGALVRSFEPA